MPTIIVCDLEECIYNTKHYCKCDAIGIDDEGCDSYLTLSEHLKDTLNRMENK